MTRRDLRSQVMHNWHTITAHTACQCIKLHTNYAVIAADRSEWHSRCYNSMQQFISRLSLHCWR